MNERNNLKSCGYLKPVRQWCLVLFLGACLTWVIIYTLICNHTEVAREKVNPFYASTYFDAKSGGRVFTYLGVFYIIPGFASLVCLVFNIRLPSVHPRWIRPIRLPWTKECWNAIEIITIILFLIVVLANYFIRDAKKIEPFSDWFSDWPEDVVWYQWSKSTGKTTALILTVLLLPVSKSCFWWEVTNYKFERCIKFHRWLGWFLVLVTIVHAGTGIVAFTMRGQFFNCMWPSNRCDKYGYGTWNSEELSRRMTYGWTAALLLATIAITSANFFHRKKYEFFLYSHFLSITFFILVHLHYNLMIYYTAPSLAAYTLDKVLSHFCSRHPVTLLGLERPAPGFVRLVIAKDADYMFEPGQWVRINIPVISRFQWHPMSISSSPQQASMTIDVKVVGDWTRKLEEFTEHFDPINPNNNKVYVDYFHGSSHTQGKRGFLSHSAVVCFSGGCGCTPMMSALRMLVEDKNNFQNIQRFVFVWVVKRESVLRLYQKELGRIQAMDSLEVAGCIIEVDVYVTLSEEEEVPGEFNFRSSSESPVSSTNPSNIYHPLRQYLFGFSHLLILTVSAGCYFLLGIFSGNVIARNYNWGRESLILFQLLSATIFTAISVVWGIYFGIWLFCEGNGAQLGGKNTGEKRPVPSFDNECVFDLQVTRGCRPDVHAILEMTRKWCNANGISSVGVAVLGPKMMSEAVIDASKKCSNAEVQFVVDEEAYEW